jgi:hypothetical protein
MTAPPVQALLARAPVPSLGVILAGCPDCRTVIGLDGAPGLANALARHRRTCPAGDVCPTCGCEGELHQRGDGWRCGDCLGEQLADDLPGSTSQPQTDQEPAIDQELQAHNDRQRPGKAGLYPSPGRFAALVDHPADQEHQAKRDQDDTQPQLTPTHAAKPARLGSAGQIGKSAA